MKRVQRVHVVHVTTLDEIGSLQIKMGRGTSLFFDGWIFHCFFFIVSWAMTPWYECVEGMEMRRHMIGGEGGAEQRHLESDHVDRQCVGSAAEGCEFRGVQVLQSPLRTDEPCALPCTRAARANGMVFARPP